MGLGGIVFLVIIGLVAGWLAGLIYKGSGFGLLGNLVVGVIGSFLGKFLFRAIGISISRGLIGELIPALAGALVLLFVIHLIKK